MTWYRSPLTEEGYESCIGSGFCCKTARCVEGARLHGPGDNCPSLVFSEGRYWCGAILEATEIEQKRLKASLHVGSGCCANLNSDRQEMLHKLHLKNPSTQGS